MNRADTIARAKLLGATAVRPVISDADLDSIVDTYAIQDNWGVWPGTQGWTETYDVNAILAEVWRAKAAQVAADYNFTADNASYSKADVLAHCLEMEAKYQAMAGTVTGWQSGNAGTVEVAATGKDPRDVRRLASRIIP